MEPQTASSLQITDHCFHSASPSVCNQLQIDLVSLMPINIVLMSLILHARPSISVNSSLSPSNTPSRLVKTHPSHKSCPSHCWLPSGLPLRTKTQRNVPWNQLFLLIFCYSSTLATINFLAYVMYFHYEVPLLRLQRSASRACLDQLLIAIRSFTLLCNQSRSQGKERKGKNVFI